MSVYNTPLTESELGTLDSWLSSEQTPPNAMPLMTVRGYFFALICAPEPVEVEVWMKEVLGEQEFKLSEDKIFALNNLYNQISDEVYGNGACLPAGLVIRPELDENFTSVSALNQWCRGFVLGIDSYAGKLLNALDERGEVAQSLALAISCLSFFSSKEVASEIAESQDITFEVMSVQMYDMMPDFIEGFAELIEIAAMKSGLFNDEGWDSETHH